MIKKVLVYGGICTVIFFVAYAPESVAGVFKAIGEGIMDVVDGFADFFEGLIG